MSRLKGSYIAPVFHESSQSQIGKSSKIGTTSSIKDQIDGTEALFPITLLVFATLILL